MPKPEGPIVEGIFAINKPPSLSSAEVIRRLQIAFNPSKLFAPYLQAEQAKRAHETKFERKKRTHSRHVKVKIGHGGTLDPMATGVLILGVGNGTKQLQSFLECTKSYEATVLFGAATDTYDTKGKVLRRAKYEHVTTEKVEEALQAFRGRIMQRPPLYSALRMDGKRLYEYAREGKEIPREIEKRAIEVKELELVEWLDGGSHEYSIPQDEAEAEAKDVAQKVLHFGEEKTLPQVKSKDRQLDGEAAGSKRKRSPDDAEDEVVKNKKPVLSQAVTDPSTLMSGGLQDITKEQMHKSDHEGGDAASNGINSAAETNRGPPAVKLRMTVTSGFYVRSLAHDLGEAVGSLACMSSLVRTRQAEYELGKNVLEYGDIEKEEGVWAPMVHKLLGMSENTGKDDENEN